MAAEGGCRWGRGSNGRFSGRKRREWLSGEVGREVCRVHGEEKAGGPKAALVCRGCGRTPRGHFAVDTLESPRLFPQMNSLL